MPDEKQKRFRALPDMSMRGGGSHAVSPDEATATPMDEAAMMNIDFTSAKDEEDPVDR